MHVYAPNGTAEIYPYSIGQLRKDNPQVSFPKNPTDEMLASYGVFSVTQADKPTVASGQITILNTLPALVGGAWVQGWTVRDKTTEELAEDIKLKKANIKARRDEAINAGTVISGITVATDDLSQQRITGAALAATVDASTTVKWKLPDDSFVTLDSTQIIGIAQGVRAHVQACFDRESELLDALAAGHSYDIDAGWPT